MRIETNQFKWIKRAVLLMMAMMFLCLWPVQAKAEEGKYYEKYAKYDYIYFRDQYILEKRQVKETVFYGSISGTMTFDPVGQTITFDNFQDEYNPPDDLKYKVYLQFDFVDSDIDSFTIQLKGENKIHTSIRDMALVYIDDCKLTIQGPGSLEVNSGLYNRSTPMNRNHISIENCDLDITTQHLGIVTFYLDVKNSDIRICREHTTAYDEMLRSALDVTTLTVDNVTMEMWTEGGNYSNAWIGRHMLNGTKDLIERPLDTMFVRGDDVQCLDENGNPLYIYKFYYGSSPSDPDRAMYYGFSTNSELDPNEEYSMYGSYAAKYVKIVSKGREEKLAAVQSLIDKINAIGTVTENSGAAIKAAREAYDALDSNFRDRVTNSDTLLKAEKQFEQINREAAQKVNDLIASLGTITTASKDTIQQAENAYNALTEDQKKYVTNPSAITQAKEAYQQAVSQQKEKESSKSEKEDAEDKKESISDKKTDKLHKAYTAKSKKVKVTSVKSKKKRTVIVKWKKQKNCDGYQIVYSRKKTFKNKKSVYVKGKGKKTYTIKKLARKKTYYVKMRTYKVINGKKAYGKWSKVHKVKVK